MNTVRTGAEGTNGARIAKDLHRPDDVRPIQVVVEFARVVIRIDAEGIARLETGNGGDRPSARYFAHPRRAVISKGYLPDGADHQAVASIEVGQSPIEGRIGGVGVSGRTRAESGIHINRLGKRIGGTELQAVAGLFIYGDLQLVTGGIRVAEIRVDRLRASGGSKRIERIVACS